MQKKIDTQLLAAIGNIKAAIKSKDYTPSAAVIAGLAQIVKMSGDVQ